MATRCMIAKVQNDGYLKMAYCHFDGYQKHVGMILKYYYQDEDKIDDLIDLVAFSELHEEIEKTLEKKYKETILRDDKYKKEEVLTPKRGRMGVEYTYIRDDGEWFVFDHYQESLSKLNHLV